MTQEEFCRLTDCLVTHENFEVFNTLYMAAGGMDKQNFCETLNYNKVQDCGEKWARAYNWQREVARTIDRQAKRIEELGKKVAQLKDALEAELEKKKELACELRINGIHLGTDELKRMAEELCGAEFTARKAMLHGMKLTENEENALVVALEELDVYRGKKQRLRRLTVRELLSTAAPVPCRYRF